MPRGSQGDHRAWPKRFLNHMPLCANSMGRWSGIKRRLMVLARREVGAGKIVWTLLLSLIAISALLALGFRSSTAFVDRLDKRHEQQLVTNYLARQTELSASQVMVQLTWDEAFRNIGTGQPNPAWADTYIGAFLYANFGYQRLYLVAPDGHLLRGWRNGEAAGSAQDDGQYGTLGAQIRRQLVQMQANTAVLGKAARLRQLADTDWPLDQNNRPLPRWSHAMVRLSDRPAIVTLVPVLPDRRYGLLQATPNHLVTVRFLDNAYLNELGQQLLLGRITLAAHAPGGNSANALALTAPDGQPVGWLAWKSELRSATVRSRVRPLFIAYLIFLVAILLGGASVIRMLRNALDRLRLREAQALHEARHDEMTGLPNRGHFIERLEVHLKRLPRLKGAALAVAFLDLDHFKYINDTLGHPAGDALVRQVAERARRRLPSTDFVARLGGDEFVVLRMGAQGKGGISQLGDDLMALFAAPFNLDGRIVDVTASCGISWAPDQGLTAEDLLRNADIALFRAKQRGRARWRG